MPSKGISNYLSGSNKVQTMQYSHASHYLAMHNTDTKNLGYVQLQQPLPVAVVKQQVMDTAGYSRLQQFTTSSRSWTQQVTSSSVSA